VSLASSGQWLARGVRCERWLTFGDKRLVGYLQGVCKCGLPNRQLGVVVRISRVQVKKLFGQNDFDITFDPSLITCITGDNGVGKTTILKLIEAVLALDGEALERIKFEEIQISFSDGRYIQARLVVPEINDELEMDLVERNVEFTFDGGSTYLYKSSNLIDFEFESAHPFSAWLFETFDNHKELYGNSIFWELVPGRKVTVKDLLEDPMISDFMPDEIRESAEELLAELAFIEPYANSTLVRIGTNRLNADIRNQPIQNTFDFPKAKDPLLIYTPMRNLRNDLKSKFEQIVLSYQKITQELASTFPARLINRAQEPFAEDKSELVTALQNDITMLTELGFPVRDLGVSKTSDASSEVTNRIISLHSQDSRLALDELSRLVERLLALKKLLDIKLRDKEYKFGFREGFWIVGESGEAIDLDGLSSGEQNLISIFHDVAMATKGESIFLIDEPEISLNILWQQEFLDDLEIFAEMLGSQFIVVTHSPSIIQDRQDSYVVPL